jgi:hypothetical protein
MPRPSGNPDKATESLFSKIEDGNYEVISANIKITKGDFADATAQLSRVLQLRVLNADGETVRDADTVEFTQSYGKKALEHFSVGKGSGPDDNDPKDLGTDVDTEGNTVFCSGDGQFNKGCGVMVFDASLAHAGFPKDILDRCFPADLVGVKFALKTELSEKINKRFAMRLNTKPMPSRKAGEADIPATMKIVDKWLNPSHKPGAAAAPAHDKKHAANSFANQTPEELATAALEIVSTQRPGEKNLVKTVAQMKGLVTNAYTKAGMPAGQMKAVQEFIGNPDWLSTAVEELGGSFSDGKTIFPE